MRILRRNQPGFSGFTLVELIFVIAILGILVTLFFPVTAMMRERAERIRCMGNLRSLHVALGAYTQLQGHWPQVPEDLSMRAEDEWLIEEMKKVQLPEEIWYCPTLKRLMDAGEKDPPSEEDSTLHYSITGFDDGPFTPYKWAGQPWAAENGNNHGDGALVAFPDGSIRTMTDVLAQYSK